MCPFLILTVKLRYFPYLGAIWIICYTAQYKLSAQNYLTPLYVLTSSVIRVTSASVSEEMVFLILVISFLSAFLLERMIPFDEAKSLSVFHRVSSFIWQRTSIHKACIIDGHNNCTSQIVISFDMCRNADGMYNFCDLCFHIGSRYARISITLIESLITALHD